MGMDFMAIAHAAPPKRMVQPESCRLRSIECGDFLDQFSQLTCQGRRLDLERDVSVAMHDLAESCVASDRFGPKSASNATSNLCRLVSLLANANR
jgi:hypothetical protein